MKKFSILLAFSFVAHFIALEANHQYKSYFAKNNKRIYVNPSDLKLTNSGIFLKTPQNKLVQLQGISCDSRGIYLSGFMSTEMIFCSSCRKYFGDTEPSVCDECGSTSFNAEYQDYWDR